MRLLIILYAGDYREAYRYISQGYSTTYIGQKYSIDSIAEIARSIEEAAFLCCRSKEAYSEFLDNGVRVIGTGFNPDFNKKKLVNIIEQYHPTHLVVRVPTPEIFRWAIKNKVRTIALLADSFLNKSLKQKIKNYLLARLLNNKVIEWVGNHGINACKSLQQIGVNPNKIVPWDLPHQWQQNYSPKKISPNYTEYNLFYVGSIIKSKGVGDILKAIHYLKKQNLKINLQLAGKGDIDYFRGLAMELDIVNSINFLGLVPNNQIMDLMNKSDLVIIPSRHEYPEGLPFTIYEALQSQTPIIASDHPMFLGNLEHEVSAMIFPAGNSVAMADCVQKIMTNPDLYAKVSSNSYQTWQKLQIPVKWGDFIQRWVNDSSEDRQWLFNHRLVSEFY